MAGFVKVKLIIRHTGKEFFITFYRKYSLCDLCALCEKPFLEGFMPLLWLRKILSRMPGRRCAPGNSRL